MTRRNFPLMESPRTPPRRASPPTAARACLRTSSARAALVLSLPRVPTALKRASASANITLLSLCIKLLFSEFVWIVVSDRTHEDPRAGGRTPLVADCPLCLCPRRKEDRGHCLFQRVGRKVPEIFCRPKWREAAGF